MRSLYLVSTLALSFLVQLAAGTEELAVTTCSNWSTRYQKYLEGVCVCTEANCDSVANTYTSLKAGEIGVYRSSKAGDRLKYEVITINKAGATVDIEFTLNLAQMYQQVIGFGGAFTDAAAINTYKLTPALQQKVLDAYFSETGLEYSTGRIPISSSDFSESIYSYNPVVDDFNMTHFSIDVDKAPNSNKLALIQRALKTSTKPIKMFASSWAPPVWMTQENSTLNCHVKGAAGGPYWKALALYYSKFIDAYKAEGVNIWGMTVQNEPGKPIIQPSVWQSLRMTVGGKEFYKQPMYYIMGHFSKFLPAGSIRFDFPKAKDKWSDIDRTAFITPEKRIVLFFFNRRDSDATATVQQPDKNTFTVSLPARSIQTIILPPSASGLA
uniref:Glycosyl hydrolase family 30 TIM-barrel domain-containing protein n=1 Tax=Globisporangium ultimum (strain ATCC 200006 / CBS 805.95 / DAOM BR144) TaxID=431595 RepID=K3WLY0_GLOUD